jgi:hypothetical protein
MKKLSFPLTVQPRNDRKRPLFPFLFFLLLRKRKRKKRPHTILYTEYAHTHVCAAPFETRGDLDNRTLSTRINRAGGLAKNELRSLKTW